MGEAVRIAFAVGYLGHNYSGSQVQPNVPTVQGCLEEALHRIGWCKHINHPVTLSSRTDAGVDARMNIGSFDLPRSIWESTGEKGFITAINDQLPVDISVWGAEQVDTDFRTRDAFSRTYYYRLQAMEGWSESDDEKLQKWCSLFVGEHDFRNFCRPQEGRSTVRNVLSCQPWLDSNNDVLGFSICAEGFVWNQVRRIASAFYRLSQGNISENHLIEALDKPDLTKDFGLADSDWLTLWAIQHSETPSLSERGQSHPPDILKAESSPTNRNYGLWADRARGEQNRLHQSEWLKQLSRF
ncbi:MAG: tRNA pseudouridine(38-40) synthase TruA [Candidatus Thermoplasmatota archaeon]|nr:tRNA pseudouridine(38-40) synthase TruA [Candidatus Thermoplasmatota archaeon]